MEQPHRLQRLPAARAAHELQRLQQEDRSRQDRRDAVDRAEAQWPRRQRRHQHQHGEDEDLGVDPAGRAHHGQHRDAGAGVVVLVFDGQGVEVRHLPKEHNRKKRPAQRGDRARHRGPADEHRGRPADAAPECVRRGAPLEPERVDHVVVEDGRRGHRRGQPVGEGAHEDHRHHRQHESEDQRRARGDRVGRQRPPLGAPHQLVDVAVDVAVERARRARRQRAADQHDRHQPEARPALGRQHHRRDRGHQQQFDDARLGQRDVRLEDGADVATTLRPVRLAGHRLEKTGRPPLVGTLGDHAHGQPPSGIGEGV